MVKNKSLKLWAKLVLPSPRSFGSTVYLRLIKAESSTSNVPKSVLMEIARVENEADQLRLWEQAKTGQITVRSMRQKKETGEVQTVVTPAIKMLSTGRSFVRKLKRLPLITSLPIVITTWNSSSSRQRSMQYSTAWVCCLKRCNLNNYAPEDHNKKHHELVAQVDDIAQDIAERERFFNELNLLKLEGRLFCFDPRAVRRRTEPLQFDELKERPITIEPYPNYGQPSVLAYKVLQAIFRKLTSEGFPVPETVSFSQRELATLVGRSSFGGQDGRQLYQAVMQLRTTLIHASFYDKEHESWALANLNVLTEAFFPGQHSQVHACLISVHPRIIESLNSRHFACLNWARLSELEPIGAALYKRLFYHFSNLMRPRLDPTLLLPFEKDYGVICAEWLGGLKPEQHKSKIISNQLGRHLEALKRIRLIRRYEIEHKADGEGWKLVFYPGNGFFNDYDEFYIKQWQPQLRPQQNADLRNIQQPLELVAYFHSFLGHDHNRFEKKETEYASKLLTEYLYDEIRDLIQFAVESATETRFAMQQFGAIKTYLPRWLAEREKRFEASKRLTAIATCTECDALGYLTLANAQGQVTMHTCPHDCALIDALCAQKGYRRV